jgi:hypothetical protein
MHGTDQIRVLDSRVDRRSGRRQVGRIDLPVSVEFSRVSAVSGSQKIACHSAHIDIRAFRINASERSTNAHK